LKPTAGVVILRRRAAAANINQENAMHAVRTVFVTGATGYIGRSIARAFRAAGWRVLGLTRDAARAASLAVEEITPVIGTLQDVASWRQAAASADTLVHAAVDYSVDTMALDRATTNALVEISSKRGGTLIYTSGAWVHGSTGAQVADETTPLAPVEIVAQRPAIENLVLKATGVRAIVIRPADVYGRRGGLTAGFFNDQPAVGDGSNHWPLVHVDDLANAYVLAAERGNGATVYIVADESQETVANLVAAARRGAGLSGEPKWLSLPEARKAMGGLADALALDQRLSAARARRELGWHPLHPAFTADAETYARANRG
jgi:nucleoside-diphosphate-sugar epimerase